MTVTQPACVGARVVPNGSIAVAGAPSVEWAVARTGTLFAASEGDVVAVASGPGASGSAEVVPGVYDVVAFAGEGALVAQPGWELYEDMAFRTVTIAAYTGVCPLPADLTDATRGGFGAPSSVAAGAPLLVSGLPAGSRVQSFLFSVPTDLGTATAAADGTLRLTIPAATPTGAHRLAVYHADGTLLGWQPVEVRAAGPALAATGADVRAGVLAALVLVAAGGTLVLARRRTATS